MYGTQGRMRQWTRALSSLALIYLDWYSAPMKSTSTKPSLVRRCPSSGKTGHTDQAAGSENVFSAV